MDKKKKKNSPKQAIESLFTGGLAGEFSLGISFFFKGQAHFSQRIEVERKKKTFYNTYTFISKYSKK